MTQVALSLVVLIGAGLCVKSLQRLQRIDPGLEPSKVLTASFDLSLSGYNESRGQQFFAQLSDRIAALPGVEAVSLANIVAFSGLSWIKPLRPSKAINRSPAKGSLSISTPSARTISERSEPVS